MNNEQERNRDSDSGNRKQQDANRNQQDAKKPFDKDRESKRDAQPNQGGKRSESESPRDNRQSR